MMTSLALAVALAAFEPQGSSPYAVDWVFDTTLTLASFGTLSAMHQLAGRSIQGDYVCTEADPTTPCDPGQLNRLDRGTVGDNSKTWDKIGSVSLYAIIGGVAVGTVLDNAVSGTHGRFRGFLADAAVTAEATGLATLTTHVLRYAVRRPRPTQYAGGADIAMSDQERHLSFPSGHVTSTSAMATAFATTFWLRHPDSPWRWVIASSSVVVSGISGYGRVGGGRHFTSDWIAGQVIGTAFGLLVPLAHRADLSVSVSTGDTKTLNVMGSF
ncbi:MAG: phosphatase PAP2 family protein [Myxococcota bacterium]|nr:phosphatase PAP2 family protein [Myxococcota bacterium]